MSKVPRTHETCETIRAGIVDLLHAARNAAAKNINSLITATYWEIGRRIVHSEQQGKTRAGYGEELIERLSIDLLKQFGRGFGARNLAQMRSANELFSDSPDLGPCGYGDHSAAEYQWGLLVDGVFNTDADSGEMTASDGTTATVFDYHDHWHLPAGLQGNAAENQAQKQNP